MTVICGLLLIAAAAAAESFPVAEQPVLEDRYPQRQTVFPDDVVSLADVVFSSPPGYRPLRLDLYRPRDLSRARPLVVYIHGGGWQSGHTRHAGAFANWPAVLAALAARGYVVASIEYRLSGEAPFPAAIDDVRAAIRWLRTRAKEQGIDGSRVLVWGGSAGGQLAALAAMQCEVKSDCVQGLIAWYGIFDFTALGEGSRADSPVARYLGSTIPSAASPAAFVDPSDPPVLLVHGVEDRTVPIQQSRDFFAKLKAQKVLAELLEIPAVDHSFIGATPEATRAASRRAIARSFEFIEQTIGKAR
jgi:acetyl esterase/lipase